MATKPNSQAGDAARDYVAAMDRMKRAEETLATAQSGLERANREVEVFRKKLADLSAVQPDETMLLLVGTKLVTVTKGHVQLIEPTVVEVGR